MRYGELFAGIGLGAQAIRMVFGDSAECKFFSEISKSCIKTYNQNHQGHRNIGDISFMGEEQAKTLPDFDFLIGGSPCNDLSIARGKREGLDGEQSGLFFAYLDILKVKKPRYFLLENVASMPEEDRDIISDKLGVDPVEITSLHFTGQDRRRLYWSNFPIPKYPQTPADPRLVIDKTDKPSMTLAKATKQKGRPRLHTVNFEGEMKSQHWLERHDSKWDWATWTRSTRYPKGKPKYVEQRMKLNMGATCLVTGMGCARFSSRNLVRHGRLYRPINALECARLQGIPDGYLDGLSPSATYSAIGNSFTLPVIVHILQGLKSQIERSGGLA